MVISTSGLHCTPLEAPEDSRDSMRPGLREEVVPNCRAVLGGLAEKEAHLLQGLGEGVFGGHCGEKR